MPLETEYNQLVEKRKKILEEMKQTEEILHKFTNFQMKCLNVLRGLIVL